MPIYWIARYPSGGYRETVCANKGYDTNGLVADMRRIGVKPHMEQNTRHESYAKSINARRGIENVFAWF